MNDPQLDISIVIPLYNEEESLSILMERIDAAMQEAGLHYEVLFIDDGSTDNSWLRLQQLQRKYSTLRAIRFAVNYGKSAALQVGFQRVSGRVVATMDADLQDDPAELPAMYRMIVEEHYDLVSGWKKKRLDPVFTKNLPSKLFNAAARRFSGIDNLHDFNCGIKTYRNEVVKNLDIHSDMHRYIPYLAKIAGYSRITEKPVRHARRQFGKSKYSINRFYHGYLDLLTLWFIHRFGRKPMHFFGLWGSIIFVLGLLSLAAVLGIKLTAIIQHTTAPLVTDRVYFFIALTCMIVGVQLFSVGFLGELICQRSKNRHQYNIKEEL